MIKTAKINEHQISREAECLREAGREKPLSSFRRPILRTALNKINERLDNKRTRNDDEIRHSRI